MAINSAIDIIPFLYQGVAIIGGIGYLPQIYKLIISKGISKDISIVTWLIWLSTWIISLLYGILFLDDWRFCLVASVNIAGHLAIIGLTLYNRTFHKQVGGIVAESSKN
jgi:hypothetical protein